MRRSEKRPSRKHVKKGRNSNAASLTKPSSNSVWTRFAVGTQKGGYNFQGWFYDLLDFCEIENHRPYVSAGRQIDGSLTLDGTTYLVELKSTAVQADAPDIDSLRSKVDDKADNTMGVMLSISGYSAVAISQASGRKTTLLLLDAMHLYLFLSGALSFKDILARVRRHASQTGEAYLAANKFSE